MDWKKNSWVFSLLGVIILAFLFSNLNLVFPGLSGNPAVLNITNNPNGVVVEEFSDFACPFCRQSRTDLYAALNRHPGQVNFMFRHLVVHPETQLGAEASECARDQGKFFEYTEFLYQTGDYTSKNLKNFAEQLNLNMTKFDSCLTSREKAAIIDRDYNDAEKRGVMGTPTFFVDGKEVALEYIDQAIEAKLNVNAQS
jgi:protein-disulfide isomerase